MADRTSQDQQPDFTALLRRAKLATETSPGIRASLPASTIAARRSALEATFQAIPVSEPNPLAAAILAARYRPD